MMIQQSRSIPSARAAKVPLTSRVLPRLIAGAALFAVLVSAQVRTSTYTAGTKFSTVTVIVGPHGLLTNQATVTGPFFLTVINRSGIRTLHFSVTKSSAPTSASAAASSELVGTDHKDGAQDQSSLMELVPGTYYLTAQQQLAWTMRLVVNP